MEVASVVYVNGLMDHLYLKHEATRYKAGLEHLYSVELASRESIDLVSGAAACRNNVPRFAGCFRGVKARYRKLTNIRLSRPATVLAVGWCCEGATDMPVPTDVREDLNWRKARRSLNHGACVEVANGHKAVAMRDSQDRKGPEVRYSASAWRSFIATAKLGGFDASTAS
jgi:hypothetical protein